MMYPTNQTGYFNIPEPSLDEPTHLSVGCCSKCKGEIYQGEPKIFEDGKRMCKDCYERRIEALLRVSPAIVAACLGIEYEEGH